MVSNMAREMKETGLKWIGEIPEDWDVVKIKYNANIVMGQSPSSDDYNDEFEGIEFLQGNVDFTNLFPSARVYTKKWSKESKTGDILLSVRAPVGAKNISDRPYAIGRGLCAITPNEIDDKFLWFSIEIMNQGFKFISKGSTYDSVTTDDVRNALILCPRKDEQMRIGTYLEEKVSQIDSIIEKTKQSIKEYKKYKQSLITEVVTKGLDTNVKMKDSGVEWVGEIPEHWKVKSLKHVLKERTEKNNPIRSTERLSLSIDKGVTLYSEKTTNLDRFKDDFTQYKLAYVGDLVFNSMNMIVGAVGRSDYFGCVSPVYYTFYDEVDNHTTAKYYEYIFRSKAIQSVLFGLGKGIMAIDRGDGKYNTVRLKISRENLRSMKLPVPNLHDQISIVDFLDSKCLEIDNFIKIKEKLIYELKFYKKSLIYEVVTGKKAV